VDKWIYEWMSGYMSGYMSEYMSGYMSGFMSGYMSRYLSGCSPTYDGSVLLVLVHETGERLLGLRQCVWC
jgi:hypothetical protein